MREIFVWGTHESVCCKLWLSYTHHSPTNISWNTLVLGNGIPWSSKKSDKKKIPKKNMQTYTSFVRRQVPFFLSSNKNLEFSGSLQTNQQTNHAWNQVTNKQTTLQGTNISNLWKRKIILLPFQKILVSSQEGNHPATNRIQPTSKQLTNQFSTTVPSRWRPSSRRRSTRTFRCWTP